MDAYANLNNNSGVVAYQIGSDYIIVEFKSGQYTLYKYTYASASSTAIETMKGLAQQGRGLNSYISTNKPPYSSRATSLTDL